MIKNISFIFITITLVSFLGVLAQIYTGKASAQGIANQVALSGAYANQNGEDPCEEAGKIASYNGASLIQCSLEGNDLVVAVQIHQGFSIKTKAKAGESDLPCPLFSSEL
jgi:secretion/DNA translocation related TadE-like protein